MIGTLLVIAKQPLPGRVKTRLTPPLTEAQAARLAAAALADTLRTVGATPARRHVLAFDGHPDGWVPAGWRVVLQPSGTLDHRLATAFGWAHGPALLVGMDTPQVTTQQLAAFDPVRFDACLGLATDGGYWAIGFRDPRAAATAIPGVPMSTDGTGAEQLRRLSALGLRVQLLDELRDVDTIEDARTVASLAPGSAFAGAVDDVCRVADAAVR